MDIEQKYADPVLNLVLDTFSKGKQCLVFVNTRLSAEKEALEIAKKIKNTELTELSKKILSAISSPTEQCKKLAICVKKGVAFHHSGLVSKQRELIESSFREGTIKAICCTPTLAAGVDLPAFRVIIRDLKRYGGRWGMQSIPTLEYHQMAGRAGRPKYDSFGEAITLAKIESEKEQIVDKYIYGESEDIHSKLAVEPVLRTYILSLIAAQFVTTRKEILNFFEQTFWAHQFQDMGRLEEIIHRMLELLEEWEFIISAEQPGKDSGFQDALSIHQEKYGATQLGKRVAELYLDPYTAYRMVQAIRRASSSSAEHFSYLHMISNTLELRPLLRVKSKEWDDIQEALALNQGKILFEEPSIYDPEYEDFMASIKTALFMQEWCDEKNEEYLLEKYGIRPGEIRSKLDIGDWLLYSAIEMTKILHFKDIEKDLSKCRMRLSYGVKEELFVLLKLKMIGRVRARKLFANGLKDIATLKKVELGKLMLILGKETATSIKKQLGEDVPEVVPKGRRKGQVSIEKFGSKYQE